MAESDVTVAILREIRDEIRGSNIRLDAVRVELKSEIAEQGQQLRAEVQETNQRLSGVEARLAAVEETLKDLAAQQLMLTRYVKNVVDRHEQSIDDLRERVVRIETRLERP
jgi:chromosome segregation ATPase